MMSPKKPVEKSPFVSKTNQRFADIKKIIDKMPIPEATVKTIKAEKNNAVIQD
jgi:hypothetical protein